MLQLNLLRRIRSLLSVNGFDNVINSVTMIND